MKAIISGITGVVGQNIGRELVSSDWSVYGISRSNTTHFDGFSIDLTDTNAVTNISPSMPEADVFIHCAALIDQQSSLVDLIKANVIGTLNALKLAQTSNVKHFINISSTAVLGPIMYLPVDEEHDCDPQSPYALSKYFSERALESAANDIKTKNGPEITSFRIPSPIGIAMPQRSILPIMLHQALQGQPLTLSGDSGRKQNFLDIRDLAQAVKGVCKIAKTERVYNIAGNKSYSNFDLATLINKVTANSSKIVDKSSQSVFPSGILNPQCWDISIDLAKKDFDYSPAYSLEQTISWLLDTDSSLK